jgi:hypothetical protein
VELTYNIPEIRWRYTLELIVRTAT